MKKIFFFDIDGTILPFNKKEPSNKTKYAIKELQKQGHEIYIATGKAFTDCKKLAKNLSIENVITTNGQVVLKNGQVILQNSYSEEELSYWENLAMKNNFVLGGQGIEENYLFQQINNQEEYLSSENFLNMSKFLNNVHIKIPQIIKKISDKKINQLWICGDIENLDYEKNKYKIVKWSCYGADVLPIGVSKGRTIQTLLTNSYQGYNSYAFGDGNNDVEMFEVVNNSIAMGNASIKTKEYANEVTKNSEDNGIYDYLVKNKIIEEMK